MRNSIVLCVIILGIQSLTSPVFAFVAPVPAISEVNVDMDSTCFIETTSDSAESIQTMWRDWVQQAGFNLYSGDSSSSISDSLANIGQPLMLRLLRKDSQSCLVLIEWGGRSFEREPLQITRDLPAVGEPALAKDLHGILRESGTVLYKRYMETYAGSVRLNCNTPVQANFANGVSIDCPGILEHIMPGVYPITLAKPGYDTLREILEVRPGHTLEYQLSLQRSKAWLDSVAAALEKARLDSLEAAEKIRRDSLLALAEQKPAKSVPELMQRLFAIAVPAGVHAVAVVPFVSEGKAPSDFNPGVMAAEYAAVHISKDSRFVLVERERLEVLLQEQAMVQAGLASDSAAAETGKVVSARYLVMGKVQVFPDGSQMVAARLVDGESGRVLSAAVAKKSEQALRKLYLESIGERVQVSATVFRSLVAPGWGQYYANQTVKGALWNVLAVGAVGYTVWRGLEWRESQEVLESFRNKEPSTVVPGESGDDWLLRANLAREDRNNTARQFNIALGVTGGIWMLNVLDAWIAGHRESQRIQTQYFSAPVAVVPTVYPKGFAMLIQGSF